MKDRVIMPDKWKASGNVYDIMNEIKDLHHKSRLENAKVALAFVDSKPYINDDINLGRVSKFTDFDKIWMNEEFDFHITICCDVWNSILNLSQKKALIDLQLTRCQVEYVPATVVEGKKKKTLKDDYGKIQYTTEVKLDDNGNPKWKVLPLNFYVISENISRFGLWCHPLTNLNFLNEPKDE